MGVGGLAVREGRNEDKWSKVQPLGQRGVTLRSVLCTGSPKIGARPVIISKISSLKLSPGRLWRLGGFQRLDTSSVF